MSTIYSYDCIINYAVKLIALDSVHDNKWFNILRTNANYDCIKHKNGLAGGFIWLLMQNPKHFLSSFSCTFNLPMHILVLVNTPWTCCWNKLLNFHCCCIQWRVPMLGNTCADWCRLTKFWKSREYVISRNNCWLFNTL